MPASWRRGIYEKVEYVIVERDGVKEERQVNEIDGTLPTATVPRPFQRSYTRRQEPGPTDVDDDSDDEDDLPLMPLSTPLPTTTKAPLASGSEAFLLTMTLDDDGPSSTAGALADNDPTETVIVALPPPPKPPHDRDGRISQTTEHLLIAAGSIGATIIIVMIILALYTMRKRGLTIKDVIQHGKNQLRRGPPPPPSKYGIDTKQQYHDDYYGRKETVHPPLPVRTNSRSGSLSTQTPLQNIGRSDSFGQGNLQRNGSTNKSFYNDSLSRGNSHRRNDSATPSSPVLPVQGQRESASTRNTRSLVGDEEALQYSDPPAERALPPAPPTFKQFLSNRPNISQRPAFGIGMASRFSWTNSNAPQTPHDPSRDTVAQPLGRDSFMTSRSSVPRFRTVDSWVNQQSNRVEEQRLKQQFRMTQSSTSSAEADDSDQVPEIPAMPTTLQRKPSGLAGKNIKHQRHDTTTTVQTAPIFRAHPGTEVRFSVRSEVPSEVLDMGRKNAAL